MGPARAAELKAAAKRERAEDKAAAEKSTMMAKIAEMPQPDRGMAERLHEIVTAAAPELLPKLYYGQPGWAQEGGKVVITKLVKKTVSWRPADRLAPCFSRIVTSRPRSTRNESRSHPTTRT
ncbi:hypothetical protein [Cryobacterium sp.]|uniref:hypothetical protein n=1 Tax=Cryobacterium sp. TaxID=1926290 RepID=UPI002626DF04|nr:hypothetical protein [Cryobacterium sp.]MCU1446371.1 hypothetical protein [Cryobacterium sp.]